MTVKDAIISACEREEYTMAELAEDAGYSSKSVISTMLSRNDGMGMRVETLIRLIDSLGYQMILSNGDDEYDMLIDGESEGKEWVYYMELRNRHR